MRGSPVGRVRLAAVPAVLYIQPMRRDDDRPTVLPDPNAARVASACALMRVRRLSRQLTRIYIAHLRDCGLTVSEYTLLAAIGASPGARATDLAAALDIEKSTLSREIRRLTEAGWVQAAASEGRAVALELTPAGAGQLAAAMPAWEDAQAEALRSLGPLAGLLVDGAR